MAFFTLVRHGNSRENQGQGTLLVPQGQDDKPSWSMDGTLLTVPPLTHGKQNAA